MNSPHPRPAEPYPRPAEPDPKLTEPKTTLMPPAHRRPFPKAARLAATAAAVLPWATIWVPVQYFPYFGGGAIDLLSKASAPQIPVLVVFALLAGLAWLPRPPRWWAPIAVVAAIAFVASLIPMLVPTWMTWSGRDELGRDTGGMEFSRPFWGLGIDVIALAALITAIVLRIRQVHPPAPAPIRDRYRSG